MTPEKLMRSRVNTSFLVLCLTVAAQSLVSFPTVIFMILKEFGLEVDPYYTEFVIPQLLYPICTGVMMIVALRCIRIPLGKVITAKPLKWDFVPYLGVFLGVCTVMNYTVNWVMWFLTQIGIVIPDIFSSYNPQTVPQAVLFFVAIAILPSFTEEVLCRAGITGTLRHFNPWVAVVVSSFAFGMMHATVQQIPFAFALGLVLGFVYVKTGNLLYPVLFHFANNAWACVLTFFSVFGDETPAVLISYIADGIFVLYGVASLIWLIRKKYFTLREIPHSLPVGPAVRSVIKAPCFWVFTGLYLFMTLANILLLIGADALGISL